jgi:HSP20 family protein
MKKMTTKEIQVQKQTHLRPLVDFPILMDWFDDFVPFSFSLRSEETHPIKIEEFMADNELTVRAELPGVDPEKDIEVTVGDGTLTIKGERREEHKGVERSDFHYGSFIRSIALPTGTDEKSVYASYKDGILEVKVQLQPVENKMKKIEINRIK